MSGPGSAGPPPPGGPVSHDVTEVIPRPAPAAPPTDPPPDPTPTDERVAGLEEGMARLETGLSELLRLRSRDADVIDKLHAENTRLRAGEHAKILKPLVVAMLRLHDQMAQLAGDDEDSDAAMLRIQLVQALELAAGVTAFTPAPGERFDSSRHSGVGRVAAASAEADNTVTRTLKAGFRSIDGTVLRAAEVEVARHDATARQVAPDPEPDLPAVPHPTPPPEPPPSAGPDEPPEGSPR